MVGRNHPTSLRIAQNPLLQFAVDSLSKFPWSDFRYLNSLDSFIGKRYPKKERERKRERLISLFLSYGKAKDNVKLAYLLIPLNLDGNEAWSIQIGSGKRTS